MIEDHPADPTPPEHAFAFKPIRYHNSSLRRQLDEATTISRYSGDKLLNSKEEYTRCMIPALAVIGRKGKAIPLKSPTKSRPTEIAKEIATDIQIEIK